MTSSAPRPPMAFRPGDRVAIRRCPDVVGEVVAVRWIEAVPGRWPGEWGYETSWGSSYPAFELIPAPSTES